MKIKKKLTFLKNRVRSLPSWFAILRLCASERKTSGAYRERFGQDWEYQSDVDTAIQKARASFDSGVNPEVTEAYVDVAEILVRAKDVHFKTDAVPLSYTLQDDSYFLE